MSKGNGGFLGVRRQPRREQSQGVWGVQDAYNADRDGVWPSWPVDFGVPMNPAPLLWLEADYGLYQDLDAVTPALADGATATAWVNRGSAGMIRCEPGSPGLLLRQNGGSPYVELNGAIAQMNPVSVRSNNYLFVKADVLNTANVDMVSSATLSDGVLDNRVRAATGASVWLPNSQTASFQLSAATAFGKDGRLWMSWVSTGLLFSNRRAGSALPQLGGGVASLTGASTVGSNTGIAFSAGLRAFGRLGVAANAKLKALLWFSTDDPLTEAQVNAVNAYLGNKWGFNKVTGSFG